RLLQAALLTSCHGACLPVGSLSKVLALRLLRPPGSTLFPYTTLFRSSARRRPDRRTGRSPPPQVASRWSDPAALAVHGAASRGRSEEHTSELQSRENLVCRLLLEKKTRVPADRLATSVRFMRSRQSAA